MSQKFELGQTVMTNGINEAMKESGIFTLEVQRAFEKYKQADFSEMEYPEDVAMNESAIKNNDQRIFATYNTIKGKIYIVTEWDRSVTTVLFPNEY